MGSVQSMDVDVNKPLSQIHYIHCHRRSIIQSYGSERGDVFCLEYSRGRIRKGFTEEVTFELNFEE